MIAESITNKRFIIIFASIFVLGATPLLLNQPNGASSAGLTVGFTIPIEQIYHLLLFLGLGVYASYLRGNAVILVPLSFIFLYVVGIAMTFNLTRYDLMPMFMLGSIVLFALSMVISGSRSCMLGMMIAASFGFHFGRYYADAIPDIASPLYFMLGNILSFALIFATAISFGLTMRSDKNAPKDDTDGELITSS